MGGTSNNVPFAALAAPNGTLTYLGGLPSQGQINSIAISTLDTLVPGAVGPFDSWANTLFLFSNVLTQHTLFHRCGCNSGFYAAPFFNYVYQNGRERVPNYSNAIGGALVGFDYNIRPNCLIGVGLAYANNAVHYFKKRGHSDLNQESVVVYGTYSSSIINVNGALWGGFYQASNKRRSLEFITSKSHPYGWNLTPHLEISKTFCSFEPFVLFDWANHWQYRYHEKGGSGFNINLQNYHASILRSETGVRLYQTLCYSWGTIVFEEKGSYVNRTACHKGVHTATFDEAFSSFDIVTLSPRGQNHGVVELHAEVGPAALDYQGEFGSSFQSHAVVFTLRGLF